MHTRSIEDFRPCARLPRKAHARTARDVDSHRYMRAMIVAEISWRRFVRLGGPDCYGLRMSTHACRCLLAALAYAYSRRYAGDERFVFGTGKLGTWLPSRVPSHLR